MARGSATFRLVVTPGAESWVPAEADLVRLGRAAPWPEVTVHLLPRTPDAIARALGRPAKRYAFRAFTRGSDTFVFCDRTETRDSLTWLIGHELGHHAVRRIPGLREHLTAMRPGEAGNDPASDVFHQLDPEERWADDWATSVLQTRYDRTWWRHRVDAWTSSIPSPMV